MDKNYWMSLIDKWFEGMTSESEEESLKRFLASDAASDPCYDEAKAVIGMFVTANRRHRREAGRKRALGWASAAAVALILISVGIMRTGSTCIMWENGEMITDRDEIIASAESSLTDIFSGSVDAEDELKNLFEIQ